MLDLEILRDEILNGHIHYLRNVSIDNVIFGYHKKELKVLLQRPQGLSKWTVSGGYIKRTETIEEAASRIAMERTGLKDLYLNQFKVFGNPDRTNDASIPIKLTGELVNVKIDKGNAWILYSY